MSEAQGIQAFREAHNFRLAKGYNWKIHVAANAGIFIFSTLLVTLNLKSFSAFHCFVLGVFFVTWALVEYLIHRFVLHGNLFAGLGFKKEHSVYHHGYFTHQDMAAMQAVDLNRVLLYPRDLLSVLGVNALLSLLIGLLLGGPTAWLFFQAGVLYLLVYEICHALCHAPFAVKNVKNKWLAKMVEHHRRHHNQELMNTKNFSVVFPVVDGILGTEDEDV